jgi:serine/threonine protein kinase
MSLINEPVMLGYKDENAALRDYPVIKLADFGLAELTEPDDERNPTRFYDRGTALFMPPVSRDT